MELCFNKSNCLTGWSVSLRYCRGDKKLPSLLIKLTNKSENTLKKCFIIQVLKRLYVIKFCKMWLGNYCAWSLSSLIIFALPVMPEVAL